MNGYENLSDETEGRVARVTIESTSRMNALNPRMVDELLDVAAALGEDDDVRCSTVTGADDPYGTGADLSHLGG